MSYPYVKRGDTLPTVAIVQMLLNRTGASLTVDGIFGAKTETALQDFQKLRTMAPGGVVDRTTWDRLCHEDDLRIVDSVDATKDADFQEVKDAQAEGSRVVHRGGMSNGVAQAIYDIKLEGNSLFLVRMHGHGTAGNIGMSEGEDSFFEHQSGLDVSILSSLSSELAKLKPNLGPYASVQLMGCNTGQGIKGRQFLTKLAAIWGCPVSAGIQAQTSGKGLFRFEGPVVTICPDGKSIKQWASKLPKFMEMTVP